MSRLGTREAQRFNYNIQGGNKPMTGHSNMTRMTGMTRVAGAAPYIAKVIMKNEGAKFEAVSAHSRKYTSVVR